MSTQRECGDTEAGSKHRPIRSYVLREGRITPAQQRAFEQLWPRFGVDFRGRPRNLDDLFGRHAPRVLEIGFGNGDTLAWASRHDPDRDHLGIEVHRPGVGRLMNALAEVDAGNVRIYRHDAVEVLEQELPPSSLDAIHIWFPDPWPKKRHHKRRLIQPDFIELLGRRLRPGGLLHLATDWGNYAEHMLEVMDAQPGWANRAGPGQSSERPPWRIETHFERRGRRRGHAVWDLIYDYLGTPATQQPHPHP